MRRLGDFFRIGPARTNGPLISVIVRTRARPSYLKEALRSIANQTYRPIEVIVVEDGPPTSQGVVDSFASVQGIMFQYIPLGINCGRCKAGNNGLRASTGSYINFLDDDDLLYPDHLEVLVKTLLEKPEHKAAYTSSFEVKSVYNPDGVTKLRYEAMDNDYNEQTLHVKNLFPIQAVMFHRDLFNSFGGFDESLELLEDWDLWLRYSTITSFVPVRKTTSEFRVPVGKIAEQRHRVLADYYRIVKEKHTLKNLDTLEPKPA
jgi:glycosyltransferase involved in cell wall biosynthesis